MFRFNQHHWVITKFYRTRPIQNSHYSCAIYSVHTNAYVVCAIRWPPQHLRGGVLQEIFKSNDCGLRTLSVIQQTCCSPVVVYNVGSSWTYHQEGSAHRYQNNATKMGRYYPCIPFVSCTFQQRPRSLNVFLEKTSTVSVMKPSFF